MPETIRGRAGAAGRRHPPEFHEVVGGADQAPFAVDRRQTATGESSIAAVALDVADHGLARRPALSVVGLLLGIGELVFHLLPHDGRIGSAGSVCLEKLADLEGWQRELAGSGTGPEVS